MPVIRVEMLEGRTREQKRALVDALTSTFVDTCGGERAGIHVVVQDVSAFDWGVGGEVVGERMAATDKPEES